MKKKLTAEDLTTAAWAAAFKDAEALTPVDTVPAGYLTLRQLAKQIKVSVTTLQRKMKFLVESGRVERQTFRIRLAQHVRPVVHYKLHHPR